MLAHFFHVDDVLRSNFTAYVYAGQLATSGINSCFYSFTAFGYNSHIAFSMNYLKTQQGSQFVIIPFISRCERMGSEFHHTSSA